MYSLKPRKVENRLTSPQHSLNKVKMCERKKRGGGYSGERWLTQD